MMDDGEGGERREGRVVSRGAPSFVVRKRREVFFSNDGIFLATTLHSCVLFFFNLNTRCKFPLGQFEIVEK